MMIKRNDSMRCLAVTVIMVSMLSVCVAEEPSTENATLTVNVVNGTTNGTSVEGATAELTLFDEGAETDRKTASVTADGKAVFRVRTARPCCFRLAIVNQFRYPSDGQAVMLPS